MNALNTMTAKAIVAIYNEAAAVLNRPTVKRFANKAKAVSRTEAILSELPKTDPQPSKKAAVKRTKAINLPFRGQLHKVMPKTLNQDILVALREGATMDELTEIAAAFDRKVGNTGNDSKERARSTVRMLHTYTGLGIRQDGDTLYVIES